MRRQDYLLVCVLFRACKNFSSCSFKANTGGDCRNSHCLAVHRRLELQCKDSESLYLWYRAQYVHLAARFQQLEDVMREAGVDWDVDTQGEGQDSVRDTLATLQVLSGGVVLDDVPDVAQRPAKRARI